MTLASTLLEWEWKYAINTGPSIAVCERVWLMRLVHTELFSHVYVQFKLGSNHYHTWETRSFTLCHY